VNRQRRQTCEPSIGSHLISADDLRAIEQNLRGHFSYLPRLTEKMAVQETPSLTLVNSGLPSDTFNVIYCRETASRAALEDALSRFRSAKLPFTVWCSPRLSDDLTLLNELRLQRADDETGMLLRCHEFVPASDRAALRITAVTDSAALADYASLLAKLSKPPDLNIIRFFEQTRDAVLRRESPMHLFVGYRNGEPVATADLFITGRTAGLYNIATREEFRHQGIGTAMTCVAIQEAIRHGCTRVSLQASAQAQSVYERLGFQSCGSFATFQPDGVR
jgi:ribosomal protein S18 acetylase RimI-like enzyme